MAEETTDGRTGPPQPTDDHISDTTEVASGDHAARRSRGSRVRPWANRGWRSVAAVSIVLGLVASVQQVFSNDSGESPRPSVLVAGERSIEVPPGSLDNPVSGPEGLQVAAVTALPGAVGSWSDRTEVAQDALVSALILVRNGGDHQVDNVHIKLQIPADVSIASDAVVLFNGNYQKGYRYPRGGEAITTSGVNIGSYGPGILGYVRLRIKLPHLECGRRAYAIRSTVSIGKTSIEDFAQVESVATC